MYRDVYLFIPLRTPWLDYFPCRNVNNDVNSWIRGSKDVSGQVQVSTSGYSGPLKQKMSMKQ